MLHASNFHTWATPYESIPLEGYSRGYLSCASELVVQPCQALIFTRRAIRCRAVTRLFCFGRSSSSGKSPTAAHNMANCVDRLVSCNLCAAGMDCILNICDEVL